MALNYFEKSEVADWRALQLWPVLAGWANFRMRDEDLPEGLISYARAGRYIGLPAVGLSRVLGIIGRVCEAEDIPRLDAIVIAKGSAEPGKGVNSGEGRDLTQEQRLVLDYDWFGVAAPNIQLLSFINEQTSWKV